MNTDNYLTSKHREACNELRKVLYGVECSDLDEGSGVKFVSGQLNEIISKLYVNKHFDDESKNDVEKMSKEIIENFEDRLQSNTWMSKSTKEKALRKLENVNVKVGYPEKWNDYSDVEINSYGEGGSLVDT
ncbi:endothelin-converting protein 1 [Clostridium beijerinckii]|nr:endothelin-converting protein 1 [Clostridium beijerinckii]